LSNVIKMRRPIERVQIRHSLRDLAHRNAYAAAVENGEETEPYDPLVAEYRRGVEEGKVAAREEMQAGFDKRVAEERARVDALMASFTAQALALHGQWERSTMQFAVAVAQLIVKREVLVDESIIIGQVRDALRHLVGVAKIKVRVNPRDEEILRSRRPEVLASSESVRDMLIETDEKIERGGCIIESESGNADARLATQLKAIELALFEQKPSGSGS
jgi:flagellar biosynthesis/type III secretory pathway protein FliH